jgi:hypothetical protein
MAIHQKAEDGHGGTDGWCTECAWLWPCQTYHLAAFGVTGEECRAEHWCNHLQVPLR